MSVQDAVRRRMLDYLASHVTMTLATTDGTEPHAATLFYANDGFDLYFLSSPNTVHSRHAISNPTVFVTISQDYSDWKTIQGLQLTGHTAMLEDDIRARDVYVGKFPFVASFPPSDVRYWQVTPSWVRMIDNTLRFAHKDEIRL